METKGVKKANRVFKTAVIALTALAAGCPAGIFTEFPNQEQVCTFDPVREGIRAVSAASFPQPQLQSLFINGTLAWQNLPNSVIPVPPPVLAPGQVVTLKGTGFGAGPDIDFSKIMIGNTRILETDLKMYEQRLDVAKQVNFEVDNVHDQWNKYVISWTDTEIQFTVPEHTTGGPLIVQVQKRTGYNESLLRPGQSHNVIDAQTGRITDEDFKQNCDVVSTLSEAKATDPLAVTVNNPGFGDLFALGEEVFWSYDFNIGIAHIIRNLDWTKIFGYQATDPITGLIADPVLLFGANRAVTGEVPSAATDNVYFDPYPQPTPIPGFLGSDPLLKGNTRSSGWAGYRYAEASNPYTGKGEWIGFNCASCHGYRVSFEASPGNVVTKVIPGLPNPKWSMKWSLLGDFKGVKASEPGPSFDASAKDVDKTVLIYSLPQGAGEHTLIRIKGEGSETDNDYQFSPIAIPNVTNYMGVRRSLSHTESYVGFEGSYIHSEEPDGATGSMKTKALQALTAYMTKLDQNDRSLRQAGMYRWLKYKGKLLGQAGANPGEGSFVQTGWESYPGVSSAVNRGKTVFQRDCASCHGDKVGLNSNEKMFRLDQVGRFFAPTVYQRKQQSIRATFLRDMYWVQHRGLLSDGHVRNLEDLVHPDRCTEGSSLYNSYYTVHTASIPPLGGPDFPIPYPSHNRKGDVFRIPKSPSDTDQGVKRNRFIERHKYFVSIPGDNDWYYWDYQKMRREYGPEELGTTAPIGLPASPHPWCTNSSADVDDLVEYILTL
ncbi:hypothetical protein EHO60_08755 [Leptospira fletcheri]|uniref:Cytochrome c domain-containing protein n=1 Tax=Leptospira fletcheri TaxID=2484981 RepID=A0A4R9GJK4_9LEPT|nr:hypothetical protein [Leptospira fletcheri]TGK12611.1 hypothetical protein EHO60_08755 [Leptospira fletcheri]